MVRRHAAGARLLPVLVLLTLTVACGKKGPPLAPLRVAPARIEDLAVAKTGDEVRASFTVPSANDNQSKPADLVSVELHAISGKPEDPFGQSLSGAEFLRLGELAGQVEIAPPPDPDAPPPPPNAPPLPPDPRPAQASTAVIVETLTKDDFVPFVHPRKKRVVVEPPPESTAIRPLWVAPPEELFSRTYVAVGVSRRGVKSVASNRVAVPLVASPGVPTIETITYDATAAMVSWAEPPGARRRVQRVTGPGEMEARSLAPSIVPTAYNLYRVTRVGGVDTVAPIPVNPAPTQVLAAADPAIVLGQERCYVVRAVQVYGNARLESDTSPVVCQLLTDVFPPAAPANLSAVGSEGGVSLIWDANVEPDLAGYLVLRGEVPADGTAATLAPLMADPIRETTYRDTTVRAGIRYVYAIVAVDTAAPRNQSAESTRVEEGAR